MTARGISEHDVKIKAGQTILEGNLTIPYNAAGIVVFADCDTSSHSVAVNKYVARVLQTAGLATLLFNLLTQDEEIIDNHTGEYRFNIHFLADRLINTTSWLRNINQTKKLGTGYYGTTTGAAAALVAAAEHADEIFAVVSRGGRPDLAEDSLAQVRAPTRLIVGGNDIIILDFNRKALNNLNCEKDLVIMPGASYLFEETGMMEKAAHSIKEWFLKHLP